MKVSFDGIGELIATFYNNGAADGYPVKMSAASEVKSCASGERFIGIAAASSEEYAGVIISGCVTLPYSGTASALGFSKLAANGSGGVKTDAAGTEYRIISVDTVNKAVCVIL